MKITKKELTWDERKAKKEEAKQRIMLISTIVFSVLLIGGIVGIEIYVWTTYGNLPVTEIPSWALWFMFKGGN